MSIAGPRYDLSRNEVPRSTDSLLKPLVSAASQMYKYPDTGYLEGLLADLHHVTPAQVLVGAGSTRLLQLLFNTARLKRVGRLFAAQPGFEAYTYLARQAGLQVCPVPQMAEAPTAAAALATVPKGGALLLANPNNPTGVLWELEELACLTQELPQDTLLIVDDAYIEFAPVGYAGAAADLLDNRPGVLRLRTFSKAHGLAGLRVGYAYGDAALLQQMRGLDVPYAVDRLARAVASHVVMQERGQAEERAREVRQLRDTLLVCLRDRDLCVPSSHGNFLWLPADVLPADPLNQALLRHGVLARRFDDGVRVTIGSDPANAAVLQAVDECRAARDTRGV